MSEAIMNAKKQIVSDYAEKIGKSKSFVLIDYRGLTVAEDTALRVALRKENVEYKVVKNRLILRAIEQAGIEGIDSSVFEGPTAIAISYEDAVAPEIEKVATIPAKPVLVAQLLGMMQSPVRSLAVVLSEIAKKQEA